MTEPVVLVDPPPPDTPAAFFAHTNPACPKAVAQSRIRHAELDFWAEFLPAPDDDFDVVVATMAAATGLERKTVRSRFFALNRLLSLPLLAALQARLRHLDFDRLAMIERYLAKLGPIDPEVNARLDAALTKYLSPCTPNQVMMSHRSLRELLKRLVAAEDDTIAVEDPRVHDSVSFTPYNDERCAIGLDVATSTAAEISEHIAAYAAEHKVTKAEAAIALLTGAGQSAKQVVLHTYKATDVPNAPTLIQGFGWTGEDMKPDKVRDVSEKPDGVRSYRVPEHMAAWLVGMDGTCRAFGCDVDGRAAQFDHRINWAEGGETHPDNLLCLCQFHHNMKTDGRVFYLMDPVTRVVYWLFEDGTWVTTEPNGPLAGKNKNWVQTFAQAESQRKANAHRNAQLLKQELDDEAAAAAQDDPNQEEQEDTPPPF